MAFAFAGALAGAAARADPVNDLKDYIETVRPQVAESACTRVIEAAQLTSAQIAMALVSRGDSFRLRGNNQRALRRRARQTVFQHPEAELDKHPARVRFAPIPVAKAGTSAPQKRTLQK